MFEFFGFGKKVEQEAPDILNAEKGALEKLAENNADRETAAILCTRSSEFLKQNIG